MGTDTWTYNSTYQIIEIKEYTASETGITTYTAYTNTWVQAASPEALWAAIDDYLGTGAELKPTWLILKTTPTSGIIVKPATSLDVILTATLMSNGEPLAFKTIKIYAPFWGNGEYISPLGSFTTNSSGVARKTIHFGAGIDGVWNLYAHFEGDSEYEETLSPTITLIVEKELPPDEEEPPVDGVVALGGIGLLILLWLILEGGK